MYYLCVLLILKQYNIMEKQFETEKYGTVLVRDVMVDTNGTDLESGVEIELIDDDNLLEVVGYSVDDFDDDFECLYNVIESQI